MKDIETFDEEKKSEVELWSEMHPNAWFDAVTGSESIFLETYKVTRQQILAMAKAGGHDVIVEAGCGTGDVIGHLDTDVPCIGIDINDRFVAYCKDKFETETCKFYELNVLDLSAFWAKSGFSYKKPLVICVNNTINIMPEEIRGQVIDQMLNVAGPDGHCMVSYWNGSFFSHAVANFYKKNPSLCGCFDMSEHVNWEDRVLETPSGYITHWMLPAEVQRLLRSYNVTIPTIKSSFCLGEDHLNTAGLSIFAWFSQSCTSRSKSYYDSEDAFEEKKSEVEIWSEMHPNAWFDAVTGSGSIFLETYKVTRQQILAMAEAGGHDVIVEAGSGTGDVIGHLDTNIPCIGIDINDRFVAYCKDKFETETCKFYELNVLDLSTFWAKSGFSYKKPLVICVNNTINIMPEEIRGQVIDQMLNVAGPDGHCMVSYWNGNFFSHAVMNFYKKNPTLCGGFDMSEHVNWEDRVLETPSGYITHWMLPAEVQRLLRSYDVNIPTIKSSFYLGEDHLNTAGLSIFAWFSQACTSRSKSYYDSEDAQTFYSSIWGNETIHVGRYDLLTSDEKSSLPKIEQISRAEALHEEDMVKLIVSKFQSGDDETPKMRILDMGCGYGGLLRRLWQAGHVWSAVGCDISNKMCVQARSINEEYGAATDIEILEESYLSVSVPDESMDLIVSMDALLHVGPEGQRTAIKEAARILRPGGWMVFNDIMEKEVVDAAEMQPIYDRIHLSKLGTVQNYKSCFEENGFTEFEFRPASGNVSSHYGTVREVLLEKKDSIGVSEQFSTRMAAGLQVWRDLAPKNIVWGLMAAQKTRKVED